MKGKLILFISLLAVLSPLYADDAVEAVAPGDIVFEKTPDIIMQDETLMISKLTDKFFDNDFSIDVNFHFINTSNKDITRKIAFALPPVTCKEDIPTRWEGMDSADNVYEKGLKDYAVFVDGNKVAYTQRVSASIGDKNITELLTRLNLPLNPCKIKLTLDGKLDPKYADALTNNHLITADNMPVWSENIYFEWTQTFPAGKVIELRHHYTPVVGTTVPMPQTVGDLNRYFIERSPKLTPIWNRDPAGLAVTNPAFVYKPAADQANLYGNTGGPRVCLVPSWILYRLTTGAYWNGGIGTFKLIIQDKAQAPFAVNKFYGAADKVETVMTNEQMTMTIHHFIPEQDFTGGISGVT